MRNAPLITHRLLFQHNQTYVIYRSALRPTHTWKLYRILGFLWKMFIHGMHKIFNYIFLEQPNFCFNTFSMALALDTKARQ